jgi:hypothetical protein
LQVTSSRSLSLSFGPARIPREALQPRCSILLLRAKRIHPQPETTRARSALSLWPGP